MAKTFNAETSSSSTDGTKKQRKKEAKREAKTMLKREQARKDVQKAEQKVAKAQAQLEACRTSLHQLEAQVGEIRTPQDQSSSEKDMTSNGQQDTSQPTLEHDTNIPPPTNQVTSRPPAEGRVDISQEQDTSSPANPSEEKGTTMSQDQQDLESTAFPGQPQSNDAFPPVDTAMDVESTNKAMDAGMKNQGSGSQGQGQNYGSSSQGQPDRVYGDSSWDNQEIQSSGATHTTIPSQEPAPPSDVTPFPPDNIRRAVGQPVQEQSDQTDQQDQ